MTDGDGSRFDTRVETNRWESFTRLTFAYFADEGYDVEQSLDDGRYTLTFEDDDRGERAVFVYEGGPPDMAQESLQGMRALFEGTDEMARFWANALR